MIEENKKVMEMSGVELLSRDQLGNVYDLTVDEVAWMVDIIVRQDLSIRERAMMLCGLFNAPVVTGKTTPEHQDQGGVKDGKA